jgi:hypothetical protein
MASGHLSRIKRPNTWLHRPMLQNVKKALEHGANGMDPALPARLNRKRQLHGRRTGHADRSHWFGPSGICLRGSRRGFARKDCRPQNAPSRCGVNLLRKHSTLPRWYGSLERRPCGLGPLSDPMGRNQVKPEQASKVLMRMPTLRSFGEGRTCGEAIDTRPSG